jgi:hypothetical protein
MGSSFQNDNGHHDLQTSAQLFSVMGIFKEQCALNHPRIMEDLLVYTRRHIT